MLNWRIPACAQLIWKRADWRICADGGSNRLYDSVQMVAQNAPPLNAICGDMDSIRQDVLTHFTAPFDLDLYEMARARVLLDS